MDIKGFAVLRYLLPVIILEQHFNVLLLILEDVYASSDVNIVMMMFFELFYLFIFFIFFELFFSDQKVVGSSPAWELRNFSE